MSAYPCKHCGAESPIDDRWCHICDSAFMTPDPEAERSDAPERSEGLNTSNPNATQEGAQEPKEGGAAC